MSACFIAYLFAWLAAYSHRKLKLEQKKAENSTKCKHKLLVALLSRANTHSALAHTHCDCDRYWYWDTNTKNQIQFVLQYHCYRIHVWCIAFNVLFTQLTAEWTTDLKRNIIKNRAECAYIHNIYGEQKCRFSERSTVCTLLMYLLDHFWSFLAEITGIMANEREKKKKRKKQQRQQKVWEKIEIRMDLMTVDKFKF